MNKRKAGFLTLFLVVCLCAGLISALPSAASAAWEIDRVTVRTEANRDPFVLDEVWEHTATRPSSDGINTSSATWYAPDSGSAGTTFAEGTYTVEITVYALDGYEFTDSVSGYINNDAAEVTVLDPTTAVLRRSIGVYTWKYTDVWKHPGNETISEDHKNASFVASGTHFTDFTWMLKSPEGKKYNIAKLPELVPGAQYSTERVDENVIRLNIYNVPQELDGWSVYASFMNPGSSANTNSAGIAFEKPKPTPTPAPTPEPTPEPTPVPAAEPEAAAPAESAPAEVPEHEHSFSAAWSSDGVSHWHACGCGEKADVAAHSMTWNTVKKPSAKAPGTERGLCSVCGYTEDREIEFTGDDGGNLLIRVFKIMIAAIVLVVVFLVIEQLRYNAKRRKKKKSYRSRY